MCVSGSPHQVPLQLRELLSSFGALRNFNLVRDEKGQSKGYAFCEYMDSSLIETVPLFRHIGFLTVSNCSGDYSTERYGTGRQETRRAFSA